MLQRVEVHDTDAAVQTRETDAQLGARPEVGQVNGQVNVDASILPDVDATAGAVHLVDARRLDRSADVRVVRGVIGGIAGGVVGRFAGGVIGGIVGAIVGSGIDAGARAHDDSAPAGGSEAKHDPRPVVTPHFLERLREFADGDALTRPFVQTLFPREEFVDVCRTHAGPAFVEIARDVERGRIDYTHALADGWLRRLYEWALGFEETDVDKRPLHFAEPLPVGELHCPHLPGAKAWVQRTVARERGLALRVKIGALGGGGSVQQTLTTMSRVGTEAACQGLFAPVSGYASVWRHADTGETILLLSITGVSEDWSAQQIAPDDPRFPRHDCVRAQDPEPVRQALIQNDARINEDYRYLLGDATPMPAGTSNTNSGSVKMGGARTWEGCWGVAPAAGWPGGGTLTVQSKWTHEVEWGFDFPRGPAFLGLYRSPGRWPLTWVWQ